MSKVKREKRMWDNALDNLMDSVSLLHDGEFLKGAEFFKEKMITLRLLPAAHQVGDEVILKFGDQQITDCKVIKVHFSECCVSYDVEISKPYDPAYGDIGNWFTRVHNVESSFVIKVD